MENIAMSNVVENIISHLPPDIHLSTPIYSAVLPSDKYQWCFTYYVSLSSNPAHTPRAFLYLARHPHNGGIDLSLQEGHASGLYAIALDALDPRNTQFELLSGAPLIWDGFGDPLRFGQEALSDEAHQLLTKYMEQVATAQEE